MRIFYLILISVLATFSFAEVKDGTTIVGDQELPQVLYLIPWKSPKSIQTRLPEFPKQGDLKLLHPCDVPESEWADNEYYWPCNEIETDKNQNLR